MQNENSDVFVFCGDLNSRPRGITHSYLARGSIAAKHFAPWYRQAVINDYLEASEEDELVDEVGRLVIASSKAKPETPEIRYLLDATLNRFCRWLRILGIDAALETEEEERIRTASDKGDRRMILFERCRTERRTLVTTSTRLPHRKDCPSSTYCINPTFLPCLEVALVHMLLTHGVVLDPSSFLGRCVVCNGDILVVEDLEEARAILREYQAPDLLSDKEIEQVFRCNGCGQGYWWCDRPNSSASRVKTAATRLFALCLQAGVPISGGMGMFDSVVDVEKLQKEGWDYSVRGSELLNDRLIVTDWLKSDRLECPFSLKSAYAKEIDGGSNELFDELLPFTNVTSNFVNTLDYIFFDRDKANVSERLYVPRSFSTLNTQELTRNGHLLPSNIWPSDHLAIGARLVFVKPPEENNTKQEDNSLYCSTDATVLQGMTMQPPPRPIAHTPRCDCGCVPPILSMFEMAELRKQARLKAQMTRKS